MHLLQTLASRTVSPSPVFQPDFFRISNPEDAHRLEKLLAEQPHTAVFDALHGQLEELLKSLNPARKFSHEGLQAAIQTHLNGVPVAQYGVWVHYRWSGRLVHILDEKEFVFLRTSRNQYKITPDERDQLATKKIGVVGLSVGQSVAVTMAMERLFGEIRLADFDVLELTNLNRIRTGIHNLDLPKAVSVAREIMEIDPFLKVTCFTDGLTEQNMDGFFMDGGKLDLLVEECDSIDIKIVSRYKARQLRVPVLMEASDRGLLDVERFDLEPDREILHGLVNGLDPEKLKTLKTSEEKLPYMMPIVGFESVSTRLKASALEIGETITTWPQLASAVTFGGGLTADVSRRILLDQYRQSGRYYVDVEQLVGDKATTQTQPTPWQPPVTALTTEKMLAIAASVSLHGQAAGLGQRAGLALEKDTILKLVASANLAPSSGNNQPWKWLHQHDRLFLFLDRHRSYSFWDEGDVFAYVGLGAALENLILAAQQQGYEVEITRFPQREYLELVAIATFIGRKPVSDEAAPTPDHQLANYISIRATNRNHGERVALLTEKSALLQQAIAPASGATLHLIDQPDALVQLAAVITACERLRFLHPEGHREFFQHEVRWSRAEAEKKRDGLDLSTFDLSASDQAGLRMAKHPEVMDLLRSWKAGKGLERFSKKLITNASAVGTICIPSQDEEAIVRGGQAVQRVWLAATGLQLAFQPVLAPLYLFNHHQKQGHRLPDFIRHELDLLQPEFVRLFGLLNNHPIFLFRLAAADASSVRSLRHPAEQTLAFTE